ncbi:MAG: TlpA disulfide reductase family protein [Syntrophomonas sp.]|uniref:peroxiredoxin family protein n=1 Tax=Syntrophomonas sp. TaxID=2053627 RepID=UPI002626B02F|nr:TlpA disulfide reductase family protein [Syntrophomonas sp.]MDD2511419.1 TlpA disulfide reductase family protein [Syntrophomonas sp.]MDD3879147.1 TlpA disulfide reductase family protein [Syntrophomonas sp.]MDD4625592.1 TlpA disulfide reductase family protein [Syntrophomonas sp.]
MDEVLQLQPLIKEWSQKDNFQVVLVSSDAAEDMQAFLEENPLEAVSVLMDPGGEAGRIYRIQFLPTSFLLNEEGQIEQSLVGWDSKKGPTRLEEWLKS